MTQERNTELQQRASDDAANDRYYAPHTKLEMLIGDSVGYEPEKDNAVYAAAHKEASKGKD